MITYLLPMSAFLWAGMILGISFFESWVKFKTPGLEKKVALNVGRTVFMYFHRAQAGWLIILFVLAIAARSTKLDFISLGLLAAILALQVYGVFPILSRRVDNLESGSQVNHSYAHAVYGLCELIKFFILLFVGGQTF